MNFEWAEKEVRDFIVFCDSHKEAWDSAERRGNDVLADRRIKTMYDDVISRMPIIEQIAERVWPEWKTKLPQRISFGWEYDPLLTISRQLLVLIKRRSELEKNLGETGPSLSVSTMHPDVWDASKSLWRNGHFGEAVVAASRSVNATLQAKVQRKDASESKLVSECFSLDAPKPGVPRLRLMVDDGSDTYKNLHSGALAFGQGCFRAIRNVLAHEYGQRAEPPEEEALHYLAAFSVLARWIDQATVQR